MRCFIAIPLAIELKDHISQSLSSSDRPRTIRRVDDSLWHLTIAFLGSIDEKIIPRLIKELSYLTHCPGTITVNALQTFPHARPHLIIASGIAHPAAEWKKYVDDVRGVARAFAPDMDTKPWHAHITLGRSRRGETLATWHMRAGPWELKPKGFELVRSTISEAGPTYKTIHAFSFRH